jgi:2,4-dienoyl-CoA reductase-like NADH-dependent reductase (Old Yellow Enzyme family)
LPQPLFRADRLRGITPRSRILVPPMCQYSAIDGVPTEWARLQLGPFAPNPLVAEAEAEFAKVAA